MEAGVRKRLLRKGTRSCAECKRRKTRCFYERPTSATCVPCRRRGTACVSQEFVDVPHLDTTEEQADDDRLKRVEQMLELIIEKFLPDSRAKNELVVDKAEFPQYAKPTEFFSAPEKHQISDDYNIEHASDLVLAPSQSNKISPVHQHRKLPLADLCQTLYAALPSQKDANIVFEAGRAGIFLQALCKGYTDLFNKGCYESSLALAALPPVSSHPVVLARKLLHTALCIQQLDPSFDKSSLNLGRDVKDAMKEYHRLASDMVTCHDDLLDSLEGIECLVCEAVYLVNQGSLRRSLVCLRRASTLGQFMGLHRSQPPRAIKQHDPMTTLSHTVTWNHIAYLERYLSLLLGLPSSTPRARFAAEEKPPGEISSEWFEKVQVDTCQHIIDRNQSQNHDLVATQNIDCELNRIANSLPTEWWSPMELRPDMNEKEIMLRVISAQMQIIHYNLLTVLHLPYLIRNTSDHRFDYSKITCTYTSREVLNRFIKFRSIIKVVFCCHLVDFCAFTAALTLLLAHLNSHGQSSAGVLTHQRLGDRALIERAMDVMDELNRLNDDEFCRETATLTRKLLDLEAKCVKGHDAYSAEIVGDEGDNAKHTSQAYNLEIPYFGTIKLSREVSLTKYTEPPHVSALQRNIAPPTVQPSSLSKTDIADTSEAVGLQPIPSQPQRVPSGTRDFPSLPNPPLDDLLLNEQPRFDVEIPDLMASAEEWIFQGVDAALFDSLIGSNWGTGGNERFSGMNQ